MNIRQRSVIGKVVQIIRMSTKAPSHLERTADEWRSKVVSDAKVVEIQDISSTVKTLKLKVKSEEFSFFAGQWVDFIIPNIETVGGYSMCSSPIYLQKNRMLELAVKNSLHPPANWIHNECKVGDTVLLKVGGQCTWNPKDPSQQKHTLFIAGGIGINPLLSMILHMEDTRNSNGHISSSVGNSVLLYSASNVDELIFKDKIDSLVRESEKLSCRYFITKENLNDSQDLNGQRVAKSDIIQALETLPNDKGVQCYVCGPPPMIKSMNAYLMDCGIEKSNIYFEQWW